MPLIYKELVNENTSLGVWEITEGNDFFESQLIFSDWERNYLSTLKHPERKKSWLASRHLLKQLMGTTGFVELLFDVHGKPFLGSGEYHISLSHTHKYAAVMVSSCGEVGIDIEDSDRDIMVLSAKFLSTAEREHIAIAENQNQTALVYWGAKEVMYKMYGKRQLDFKAHMQVLPFTVQQVGNCSGLLLKHPFYAKYTLEYLVTEKFSLVYSCQYTLEASLS